MYARYGYVLLDDVIRVPLSLTSISLNSECRNRLQGATCIVLSIGVPLALTICAFTMSCVCDTSMYDVPAPLMSNSIGDRKSTRLNSSHPSISYAVFCLKKKKKKHK